MPTLIDSIAVTTGGWRNRRSARRLAGSAGVTALEKCGLDPTDVDLLVNAGLYHDRNLGEPALAPLIQEDIRANPSDPFPGGVGTFSFDVANGSAGVLNALQIVDGFMRAGTIQTALVLASDADPGHGLAPGFPFAPAGGAMVCTWGERPGGIGQVRWCRRSDDGDSFRTTVGIRSGRNALVLDRAPAYVPRLLEAASSATSEAIGAEGLTGADIDVVMVWPGSPELVTGLAAWTGIPEQRFVASDPGWHTVAPMAVMDEARRRELLGAGSTALLIGGGAGVTAGAAVYRA